MRVLTGNGSERRDKMALAGLHPLSWPAGQRRVLWDSCYQNTRWRGRLYICLFTITFSLLSGERKCLPSPFNLVIKEG